MKYLALDIGGSSIKAALMNEDGEFLEKWKLDDNATNEEEFIATIDECIKDRLEGVSGIAMSLPGRMNSSEGIMETGGAYRFISMFPIKKILEEKYGIPVEIDNDGKCAANAEAWKGALRDVNNGLVYVIGTGIGGGIVIDKKVYRGSHFAAGELSCPVTNHFAEFACQEGIIAHEVATPALLRMYQEKSGEEVSGVEFFDKVNADDEVAVSVLREFAKISARYFYTIQTVLDVEKIAVGGGISAQPKLLEFFKEELDKVYDPSFRMSSIKPELVRCEFGNDANLIGALKNYLERH